MTAFLGIGRQSAKDEYKVPEHRIPSSGQMTSRVWVKLSRGSCLGQPDSEAEV